MNSHLSAECCPNHHPETQYSNKVLLSFTTNTLQNAAV